MTVRTARKAHKCEHYRWCKRVNEPLTCTGTIEPGEHYAECPEYGDDVYHPVRYHVACYNNMMAESAEEIPV